MEYSDRRVLFLRNTKREFPVFFYNMSIIIREIPVKVYKGGIQKYGKTLDLAEYIYKR